MFKEKSATGQRRSCLNVVLSSQNSEVMIVLACLIIRARSMAISRLKCCSLTVAFVASPRVSFPVFSHPGSNGGSLPPQGQPATFFSTGSLLVAGHISLSSLLRSKSNINSKVLPYLTWTSWKASMWTVFGWSQWDLANHRESLGRYNKHARHGQSCSVEDAAIVSQ